MIGTADRFNPFALEDDESAASTTRSPETPSWHDDIPHGDATPSAPPDFIDDARALADAADNAPADVPLIEGFVLDLTTWLLHGDWRSFKTWVILEVAVAGATGTPAFGLLPVPKPFRTLFVTNEDSARRLGGRIAAMCRARELVLEPGLIGVSAHRGVWMDDTSWQQRVEQAIVTRGYRLVACDPLRSVTGCVDQGPREFQPFALASRRIVQAGAAVAWGHHDGKPSVGQADTRRRGHRASGGGIVSAADCPVHAERIGEEPRVILMPHAWKHASDPPSIEVALDVTERDGKLWTARLTGRHVSATSSAETVLIGKIRNALGESPGLSGTASQPASRATSKTSWKRWRGCRPSGRWIATRAAAAGLQPHGC